MKAWSISTTIRNPERIPDFLRCLRPLDGLEWNLKTQEEFYIWAIALRVVSPTSKNLSTESLEILDGEKTELSFSEAKQIFDEKQYTDSPMRGRTQMSPLVDFGLARTSSGRVEITKLGQALLANEIEFSEVMLNFDFKFQVPQPDHPKFKADSGYGIKPFVGTLALIDRVNKLWSSHGHEPVGLSWEEFCIFAPTLTHYKDIERWAEEIVSIRKTLQPISGYSARTTKTRELQDGFLEPLLEGKELISEDKIRNNLFDYGDNAFRYFKQTGFLRLRGSGHYVDISPISSVQAESLLEAEEYKPLNFGTASEYQVYIEDLTSFVPPWTNEENARRVEARLTELLEAQGYEAPAARPTKTRATIPSLLRESETVAQLRKKLIEINLQSVADEATSVEFLAGVAEDYERLSRGKDMAGAEEKKMKPSVQLEYLSYRALLSVNDLLEIKPNYPTDDEGNPVFTAGAGVADIEVFYEGFNLICEVSMLTNRQQWVAEGQPVQRHLFDFSNTYKDKDAIGIFLAPRVHRDTRNTFRQAYFGGYDSSPSLRIIPFDFSSWKRVLDEIVALRKAGREIKQDEFFDFLTSLTPSDDRSETSDEWWERISEASIAAELA